MKLNCWEQKGCGREIGGVKTNELGVCPASTEAQVHGINGGQNGGRACWAIAGTMCGGAVQGSFAIKYANCKDCGHYKMVQREEGHDFIFTKEILVKLRS